MTLNTFFLTDKRTSEQNLLEDLVIESIKQYGQEFLYLPRRRNNFDQLTYSDDQSTFDTAYPVEMYIKSIDGFSGDRIFMSKFDVEIRDQIIFTISRRRFDLEIGTPEDILAPREGDLIYFPMNRKIFQIMFVDNKPTFYQLGHLQTFNMTCEVYEYSSEKFITGIDAIDVMFRTHTQNIIDHGIIDHSNYYMVSHDGSMIVSSGYQTVLDIDMGDDNVAIQTEQNEDTIVDFTESNPFSEKNY